MSELLEKILSDENMKLAQKRVYANKGASGVDGVTVQELEEYLKRSWSVDLTYRINKINQLTRGWINYFAIADMKTQMKSIDGHLRTMMRVIIWKQWKVPSKREWGLKKLGVLPFQAHEAANTCKGYVAVSRMPQLRKISKEILTRRGLVSIEDYYLQRHALKLS